MELINLRYTTFQLTLTAMTMRMIYNIQISKITAVE